MLISHHSGSLGKMTMTRSPLWTSHAPARIFAVLENKRRRYMQLHPFTSSLKETINVLEIRTADDKSTEISSSLYETQLNLLPPQLIKSQYQKLRVTWCILNIHLLLFSVSFWNDHFISFPLSSTHQKAGLFSVRSPVYEIMKFTKKLWKLNWVLGSALDCHNSPFAKVGRTKFLQEVLEYHLTYSSAFVR